METLIHEAGAGQMKINFSHGDPMDLADRGFLFKRTVRETALRRGIFATFVAKPMEMEPGSAMHIHQSVLDMDTARDALAGVCKSLLRGERAAVRHLQPGDHCLGTGAFVAVDLNFYKIFDL